MKKDNSHKILNEHFLLILIFLFVPNKFLIFRRQLIMKKAKSIVASLELFDQLSPIIDHLPTTTSHSQQTYHEACSLKSPTQGCGRRLDQSEFRHTAELSFYVKRKKKRDLC